MSQFSDQVTSSMQIVMDTKWQTRNGTVVPKTEDVALSGGAVELAAAYLYADMAESTLLQKNFKAWFAAKITRMYLNGASMIIRNAGGSIKSFDGDRVMGIFVGDDKCDVAVLTALQINWLVQLSINPIVKTYLDNEGRGNTWTVSHGVGVDVGTAFIARAGVRNSSSSSTHNDLISVGRAPNVAAKLSSIRDYGAVLITADVYEGMSASSRTGGNPVQNMWTRWTEITVGPYTGLTLYSSSWRSRP